MRRDPDEDEPTSKLSEEEIQRLVRSARRQARDNGRSVPDEGIDWMRLAYITIGGSLLILLLMQA